VPRLKQLRTTPIFLDMSSQAKSTVEQNNFAEIIPSPLLLGSLRCSLPVVRSSQLTSPALPWTPFDQLSQRGCTARWPRR
jgi:hypothetical protein